MINTNSTSYWKRLFSKYRSFFKKSNLETENKAKAENTEEDTNEKREREYFEKIRDHFENSFKQSTSLDVEDDKLNDAINRFIWSENQSFVTIGSIDGRIGVKNNYIESESVVKADYIIEHAKSIINGKLKGLGEQHKHNSEIRNRYNEDYDEEKIFYEKVLNRKRYDYRHFSFFLAYFYCILGFLMLIADLPISVGISEHFITVSQSFLKLDLEKKLLNKEVLLFTLGITSLSIFFKILFDEYFNKSVVEDKVDNSKQNTSTYDVIKAVFYVFLLLSLLFTYYNIGHLRSDLSNIPMRSQYSNVKQEDLLNYRFWSFVGVTIILPIISGICLSLGLGIFSNRRNYDSSKKNLEKLNQKISKIEEDENKIIVKIALLEKIKDEWDNIKRLNQISERFTNSYNQAYKRSHRFYFGSDLYEYANSLYMDKLSSKN